jgi:hypothetical protein
MSSKNLYYVIEPGDEKFDQSKLPEMALAAVRENAKRYLSPPINNISYKGITKTSKEVIAWYNSSKDVKRDFSTSAMLMERAGTGGALFRNLYRDFLKEAYKLTKSPILQQGYQDFCAIAKDWSRVIELFQKIADTSEERYVIEVSELFKEISAAEYDAMQKLAKI